MPVPMHLAGLSRAALLSDIRRSAQERILRRMYAAAPESNDLLLALAEAVRAHTGLAITAIPGPVKGEARARQKTAWDYGGDFTELKDVVRMTLIVSDTSSLTKLRSALRTHCVASNGYGIIKDQETSPIVEPCGYSGLNFVVRLPNGRPGEIQANLPQIMFGKMSKASFVKFLGASEHLRLQNLYRIEGGLGHLLYEIFRTNMKGKGGAAATLSKLYYAYLRSPPNMFRRQELELRIPVFTSMFPEMFAAHGAAP